MEQELYRQSVVGAVTVVLRALKQSHVVKRDLSRRVRHSVYQSIDVPTLTYGHEFQVMTEIIRSQIINQVAKMSWVQTSERSSAQSHQEKSGDLGTWMPACIGVCACQSKRRQDRPRAHWRHYICRLAWEHLVIPREVLVKVAWETVCISLMLLPCPN